MRLEEVSDWPKASELGSGGPGPRSRPLPRGTRLVSVATEKIAVFVRHTVVNGHWSRSSVRHHRR